MAKYNSYLKTCLILLASIPVLIILGISYLYHRVNTPAPYNIADSVLIERIDQESQKLYNGKVIVWSRLIIYKDGTFEYYMGPEEHNHIDTHEPYTKHDLKLLLRDKITPEELTTMNNLIDSKKYTRRTEAVIPRYVNGFGEPPKNHIGEHYLIKPGNKTIEIRSSQSIYDPIDPIFTIMSNIIIKAEKDLVEQQRVQLN